MEQTRNTIKSFDSEFNERQLSASVSTLPVVAKETKQTTPSLPAESKEPIEASDVHPLMQNRSNITKLPIFSGS